LKEIAPDRMMGATSLYSQSIQKNSLARSTRADELSERLSSPRHNEMCSVLHHVRIKHVTGDGEEGDTLCDVTVVDQSRNDMRVLQIAVCPPYE
jgi:hypothetical protein